MAPLHRKRPRQFVSSYSFERVAVLGRIILLLSPGLHSWHALRLRSGCSGPPGYTMLEFACVLQKGTTSRESFDATKYSHFLKKERLCLLAVVRTVRRNTISQRLLLYRDDVCLQYDGMTEIVVEMGSLKVTRKWPSHLGFPLEFGSSGIHASDCSRNVVSLCPRITWHFHVLPGMP